MRATQLIGKLAIRKSPVDLGNGHQDYSYCSTPIKIVDATSHHIHYLSMILGGETPMIMDLRWCDDNWIEYVKPGTKTDDRKWV